MCFLGCAPVVRGVPRCIFMLILFRSESDVSRMCACFGVFLGNYAFFCGAGWRLRDIL